MMNVKEKEKQIKAMMTRSVEFAVERYQQGQALGNISRATPEDIQVRVHSCGNAYVYFQQEVYSHHIKHISYPRDWVEAVKERWLPAWLQRHYPVKYKQYDLRAILMDIPVDHSRYRMALHTIDSLSGAFVGKSYNVPEAPYNG